MHIQSCTSFFAAFVSCSSALVTPALITPAPEIAKRQGSENICGYYSLEGSVNTLSCSIGTPCLVATATSPAVGYCGIDNAPVTTVYAYGNYPIGGCGPGAGCCPATEPAVGKYLFNGGSTVFLGCGPVPFTYTAYFSARAGFSTPTDVTTPLPSASPSMTPAPSSGGNSGSGSGSGISTGAIVIIVVGAVVALIGGCVFLWFLYRVWRIYYPRNNQQWQNYTHSPSPSNLNGTSKETGGFTKWVGVATIISSVLGLAGLAVAIYFGLKPTKVQ
ncbi:hypothetical protein N7G274_002826 [Stereocaulon virgatum]|uniref:Uncharacterized protein n=1 Tax=Stereocaulon virgatum TaxID=373712 RepID=A0ABR4AJL6_9LECA